MSDRSSGPGDPETDFFVSYAGVAADRRWAEWIAWNLEEAGYTTFLQVWESTVGSHLVHEVDKILRSTRRVIVALSDSYGESPSTAAEWQEVWRTDPTGEMRKLLVFRIEDCQQQGLLGQIVSEDLFGVDEHTARSRLLGAVKRGRRKPSSPPEFPFEEPPPEPPTFPGRLVPGELDAAMAAGGPMVADNPFAIAFVFWSAILNDNIKDLRAWVTPESRRSWKLSKLKHLKKNHGLATGVFKPCYDVAHVRLVEGISEDGPPLMVEGGPVPSNSRIISLVYRPELGGWRVHGVGYPLYSEDLPRTWKNNDVSWLA